MHYAKILPKQNIEYFFDVEDKPTLSHVIFVQYDHNDFPLFLNLDTQEITFITQRQFSSFYSKNLKKEVKTDIPLKNIWVMFNKTYEQVADKLKSQSDFIRLSVAYNALPFPNDKIAVIQFAEGKKLKNSLSEEEQSLVKEFRKLGIHEKETILSKIKSLAKPKDDK